MGIHVLASNIAGANGILEPQRKHNWSIDIGGMAEFGDMDTVTLSLLSFQLPTGSNTEVEIPYGNSRVWVPGQGNWNAIPLVIRDWVDRPVAQTLLNWRKKVWNPLTDQIGLARDLKRGASVIEFGPNSTEGVATFPKVYTLQGVWPTQMSPGELDMTSSEPVLIQLMMRYDKMLMDIGITFPAPYFG